MFMRDGSSDGGSEKGQESMYGAVKAYPYTSTPISSSDSFSSSEERKI